MKASGYLTNPMGKGSSVMMLKEVQLSLDRQFQELSPKMKLDWYTMSDKYLIAHVKVPSRSRENLFYDVLLEFDLDTIPKNASVINQANIRVFSNCPSFTFTYANVFDSNGDLIDWCKGKYPRKVFSKDPITRNPYKLVSYERSIYLAIKFVLSNGRNYKAKAQMFDFKVKDHKKIYSAVKSSDEILELYENGKPTKELKKKEEEKKKLAEKKNAISKKKPTRHFSTRTKSISSVKRTSKISKTKKSNKI